MRILRSVTILAFASAALSASAQVIDAYSMFERSGAPITPYAAYSIGNHGNGYNSTQGFQFRSGASGTLAGFRLGLFNYYQTDAGKALPFKLDLYSNSSSDRLGTLLGSYSGTTTGTFANNVQSLAKIEIADSNILLERGTHYWIVLSSPNALQFSMSPTLDAPRWSNGFYGYKNDAAYYSVQVSNVTAVPGPFAALPFALMALKRRRRA